jgi:hypothetical protein
MVTTVLSKPTHYERLGIAPDAGAEEIARAFALAMSPLMPRSARDIADIATAFQTLRDPAKRRAYDASIAPPPEPEPEPEPELETEQVAKAMFPRDGWPFVASARIGSAELPAIDTLSRPAPKADSPVEPTPFIAPHRRASDGLDEKVAEAPAPESPAVFQDAFEERFRAADHDRIEWKRPALTIGALFAGVAVLGAGLGWYASRGIAPAQAEDAVTVRLPKEVPAAAAPASAAIPTVAEARPDVHRTRPAAAKVQPRRSEPPPQPVLPEEQKAQDVPDIPSEQVAALTSAADEAPAAMPLPNAVIARTIGRIGYACGEVASTSAVEGASGVFKVTCTSGQSYRAAPVRGRYHFKRWRD